MLNTSFNNLARFTIIIGLLLLMSACGQSATIKTNDGNIEVSSSGNEVKLTTDKGASTVMSEGDDGSVSMETTDENGKEQSTQFSESKELPKDFPTSVPMPDGANVTGSIKNTVDGADSFIITFDVEMKSDELHKLYADYLKKEGFTDVFDMAQSDVLMLSGKLNSSSFSITASQNTEDNSRFDAVLTWTEEAGK